VCIFTFHTSQRASRLVSIFSHGNRRLYDQNTQIITEVDVKLNKWHIAMASYVENQLKYKKK